MYDAVIHINELATISRETKPKHQKINNIEKPNIMKKSLLTLLLIVFTSISFSQTKAKTKTATAESKITTKCTADISCSQKFGITETEREYTLTVIFDKTNLKFSTYDNPNPKAMNNYTITKKTDKYIVANNEEGNYAFFDIKKKQFYNIDYYMNRYITAGYGSETSVVKQTVLKMMETLKSGSTQKDVIQNLIKQSEYDF